jgi:long-chain acyl-CoA synthetase
MSGEIISGDRRVPIETVMARAARAAAGLAALGVRRGDTVALYLRNDIAFFEASYAAGLLGAYATPVNWHYVEDEARYLFADSAARAVVIHADLLEAVREALPPGVARVVVATPPEVVEAYAIPDARCAVPTGESD